MSTIINALTPKATLDGTEIFEISEGGTGSFKATIAAIVAFSRTGLTANRALETDGSGNLIVSPVTSTELNFLDGVTSSIQTQLDGKQASLGFTPEDSANKGAVSGYAGLDASQLLLLANFPAGSALEVLRRNAGNTALEFAAAGDMVLASAQTNTGIKTFLDTTMKLRNVANTFDGYFVNTNTADRIYTLPDVTATLTYQGGPLGTPSSGVATNLTGTAAGLTAGNVTTNANLTGDVTSIGNATTIAVGAVDIAMLSASGTPDGTTFLRGDNTWSVPAGGGDMILASAQTNTGIKTFLDTTMKLRNVDNTFDGYFVNTNTADRIYTLPDVSGDILTSNDAWIMQDNIRATFNPGSTNSGINVGPATAAPSSPVDGDIYLNTTSDQLFGRINGVWVDLGAAAGSGDMILADVQTVTGAKTFGTIGGAVGKFILAGSTSGTTIVNAAAVAGTTTVTLPATIDTLVGKATVDTLTNKTIDADGTGNTISNIDVPEIQSGSNILIAVIPFVIDGGGSAITTGIKGDIQIDFDCTINQVTMLADQSGSIVVDIWKDTYANFPATDADSITASAVPTISTAVKSQDATLTGWTTSITAGDHLRFNVDSITSIERVTIALQVTKVV